MIYRVTLLSTILLAGVGFTLPAYASGQKSWVFKGTCSGNIAESDGVQTGAANGMMSTKAYFALMKRAKAAHLTLGADGLLWATKPIRCDSSAIVQMGDYPGHTMVTFSNGDPNSPILGFAGGRIDGDGPLFFSDTIYLADGKAMPLNSGTGQGCHFYFTDHGTFTQGWESRLTTVECNLRVKGPDGHLVNANVTFDVFQPPPVPRSSRDPATDKPQKIQARAMLPNADATPVDPHAKAFTDCLISKARNGRYSSLDGGKSATRLLGECPDQWKEYVDACMRSGDTDGDCTLKSGILAQAALKLLNK